MAATDGSGAATAPVDPRRARRTVWLLSCTFGVAAAATWTVASGLQGPADHVLSIPWFVLAAVFVLTDLCTIDYELRDGSQQSLTFSEVALLIGLAGCDGTELLAGRAVSALLVGVFTQTPLKAAFNVAQQLLGTGLALLVYSSLLDGHSAVAPAGWLAGAAAVITADAVSSGSVLTAISASVGRPPWSALRSMLGGSVIVAVTNASLGLLALTVLSVSVHAVWLLAIPAAAFVITYRTHQRLRTRFHDLESVHGFTASLAGAGGGDEVVVTMLVQIRELLRAEVSELVVLDTGVVERVSVHDGRTQLVASECTALEMLAVDSAAPALVPSADRRPEVRAALDARGFRDAIAVPLSVDRGTDAVLLVANRLGDVATFGRDDARIIATLGRAAALALRNGRLLERLQAEADARRHQALHDTLTGLANRAQFAEIAGEALTHRAPGEELAVLLLDLDHFKEVNDTLGHYNGDALLCELARRLTASVGGRGTVARFGGDEFAVLLPSTSAAVAARAAARIGAALAQPVAIDDVLLEMSASIGVAMAPDDGEDIATLVQRADVAMYSAKNLRSGVELYRAVHDVHSTRRLALLSELRSAIDNDELVLVYQPQVDLATSAVVSVEALVRWHHPRLGTVPPDEFIPLAERSGLIRPLTRWVLAAGIEQLGRWREDGHDVGIAINLSAQDLLTKEFVDSIRQLLDQFGVPAGALTLELTETTAMSDTASSAVVLTRLAELGVRIAIDDFGTGHSSLARLGHLPVNEVKIDRSFVKGMGANTADLAVVRATVDLARNLSLDVVAEGVEDQLTMDLLAGLACSRAQGYHIARPGTAQEVAHLLDAGWATTRSAEVLASD